MASQVKTKADRQRAVRAMFFFGRGTKKSVAAWRLDPAIIHDLISAQVISGNVVAEMRSETGFSTEEVSRVLGISPRTMTRREEAREPLTVPEADRALRFARVLHAATDAIGDLQKAVRWLRKRNVALTGVAPLELLETEPGTEVVMGALDRIAYGGVV